MAEQAGGPLDQLPLKVIGKQNEGASREVLRLMEEADARGVPSGRINIRIPLGSAPFISQIPPKFARMVRRRVERLKDRAFRKEVEYAIFLEYMNSRAISIGGYEAV